METVQRAPGQQDPLASLHNPLRSSDFVGSAEAAGRVRRGRALRQSRAGTALALTPGRRKTDCRIRRGGRRPGPVSRFTARGETEPSAVDYRVSDLEHSLIGHELQYESSHSNRHNDVCGNGDRNEERPDGGHDSHRHDEAPVLDLPLLVASSRCVLGPAPLREVTHSYTYRHERAPASAKVRTVARSHTP